MVAVVMVGYSGGGWRIFKTKEGAKRKKCNILEREKMRCEVARGGNMELFCPLKDA